MSYEKVFEDAFEALIRKYQRGKLRFLDENSLRSALFFECLDIIDSRGLRRQIEPNASIPGTNWKADLVLGGNEVVCELKFEPCYPRTMGWKSKKNVVIWKEALRDIARIEACTEAWAASAHFIIIDEDGKWQSKDIEGGWKPLRLPHWTSHLAHITKKRKPHEPIL